MALDFVTEFHKIEGVSIGEQQKNLHKLLKNTSITSDEKPLILKHLEPRTYLEKLFYVDVLIHLRETNRLLEIFKEGNGVFVSKLMKQSWFFQEAFGNVDAKELVHNCLFSLSFTLKIKLLRKVSLVYTEEKIDEVFDYVVKRYGLFLATTFLTTCSSEKIAEVLKNNQVKLSTHQLKILYRKNPNLINIYLKEQRQYGNKNIFDNHFLTFVAQKDPSYFWELIEEYKFESYLKLGRRTTKKLIVPKKQEIVTDPKKYIKYLRCETLVRKLNKQGNFKELYYNLFPRHIEVLDDNNHLCHILLKYYPKSHQYDLFTNTFNDVMKEDIWSYTNCMHDGLMELITDTNVRENWAQLKYRESNNEEYLMFYEIQKSVSLIKEKINATASIKKRTKLITLLVKSCAINNDLKTLEEVLKYFCVRHRNDSTYTRDKFLQAVEFNFDLKKFSDAHWKYLNEIFTVQSLNKEYATYGSKLRLKHIEYVFNNNGSEEEKSYLILEYIKVQLECYSMKFNTLEEMKNKEVKKNILLQAVEYIDKIIKTHDREYQESYLKSQILVQIFLFNRKHPESRINIQENEKLVAILRNIIKEGAFVSQLFHTYFVQIICKLDRNELENELLNLYLEKPLRQSFEKTLLWYLKHDPLVVVNNYGKIMESLPLNGCHIWNVMKRYTHLSLDEKVENHCLHELKHGEEETDKTKFIVPLSVLSSSENYIKIMEDLSFIPTSSKIALEDVEARNTYEIQKTFLKYFKNFEYPLDYMPLLLEKFCQGDYLQGSLSPLYFAFHKCPEHKLHIFLDNLSNNKAMSVKKHSIYLACYVFSMEKVLQMYDKLEENKKESLQKYLCLSSLRYFSNNPNRELFEKGLLYMTFLKEYDTESLNIVSSLQVPKYYKLQYLLNLWKLLENFKGKSKAVGISSVMSSVLEGIDRECISNLPQDFCKAIINNYFKPSTKGEDEVSGIFSFIIKLLMHHESQTDVFNFVFKLLANYKLRFWDLRGKERNMVYNLFDAFYKLACEEKVNLDFVVKFSKEWENLFTPNDTFKEYVLLNLLQFKKEAQGSFAHFSKNIVLFAEQINAKYGEFIFSKFIAILSGFADFDDKEKGRTELLTNILKYKSSTLSCILVIELISIQGDLFYENKVRPIYREIYSILKEIPDPKVQLCYNLFSRMD